MAADASPGDGSSEAGVHDDGDDGDDNGTEGLSRRAVVAAVIAVVGIVGSGIADFLLSGMGGPTLGAAVWTVGYLSTVVALWYVLLRPLDLDGDGAAGPE
jgi:hypothetical protein